MAGWKDKDSSKKGHKIHRMESQVQWTQWQSCCSFVCIVGIRALILQNKWPYSHMKVCELFHGFQWDYSSLKVKWVLNSFDESGSNPVNVIQLYHNKPWKLCRIFLRNLTLSFSGFQTQPRTQTWGCSPAGACRQRGWGISLHALLHWGLV